MISRGYRIRKASVLAIGIIAVGLFTYVHCATAATRRAEKLRRRELSDRTCTCLDVW